MNVLIPPEIAIVEAVAIKLINFWFGSLQLTLKLARGSNAKLGA